MDPSSTWDVSCKGFTKHETSFFVSLFLIFADFLHVIDAKFYRYDNKDTQKWLLGYGKHDMILPDSQLICMW